MNDTYDLIILGGGLRRTDGGEPGGAAGRERRYRRERPYRQGVHPDRLGTQQDAAQSRQASKSDALRRAAELIEAGTVGTTLIVARKKGDLS